MPSFRIEVTLPDPKKFESEEFVKRIEDKMREKTGPELKSLFQETVEGWEEKPTFAEYHTRTATSISTRVSTAFNGEIYVLVSKGSPPHTIRPKNSTFLRFQPGYRAATHPGIIGSMRKQRFGSFVKAEGVNHPGFEGRQFDKMIGEFYKPDFERDMADAMKE